MINKFKPLHLILMAASFAVVIYMLFYNLGEGYLVQTDEAYHATNAYEMYKQGNWVINTYRYATDYFNSKPPLCLDLMVMAYKVFGVSGFAARFPSALGGLIICVITSAFLLYDKRPLAAALFPLLLGTCSKLFSFHMFRAAEMDSLYNMFFTLAMLTLFLMIEHPDFMYAYGLCLGLAFMCKGPHAAIIFIIGLLSIPVTRAAFRSVKRVILSAVLAAIIPCLWMVKRFMFDGFELLNALFFGEVVERVADADTSFSVPILDFVTSNIFILFVILLAVVFAISMIAVKKNVKETGRDFTEFFRTNYIFILWAFVPVAFFSATKSSLSWYTYTSQIAVCILAARLVDYCVDRISTGGAVLKCAVPVLTVVLSVIFIIPTIRDYINVAGNGGHPVDQLTFELKEMRDEYGDSLSGKNAYLIADFLVDPENTDHWEPEYVAPAEMYLDLIPVDGEVDNFLSDDNAIIIVDKDKWDEYAAVLSGYVILHDDSYLIFSSDRY